MHQIIDGSGLAGSAFPLTVGANTRSEEVVRVVRLELMHHRENPVHIFSLTNIPVSWLHGEEFVKDEMVAFHQSPCHATLNQTVKGGYAGGNLTSLRQQIDVEDEFHEEMSVIVDVSTIDGRKRIGQTEGRVGEEDRKLCHRAHFMIKVERGKVRHLLRNAEEFLSPRAAGNGHVFRQERGNLLGRVPEVGLGGSIVHKSNLRSDFKRTIVEVFRVIDVERGLRLGDGNLLLLEALLGTVKNGRVVLVSEVDEAVDVLHFPICWYFYCLIIGGYISFVVMYLKNYIVIIFFIDNSRALRRFRRR